MPKANIPTITPTSDDWVRLAAFIDGEGYIGILSTRGKRMKSTRYMLKMEIANTDLRLPVWCKERFGGSVSIHHQRKSRPNESTCYHWIVVSQVAANLLRQCLPHFILKKHEAEIAIEFQKTFKHAGGGVLVPQEVIRQRAEMRSNLLSMGGHGKTTRKRNAA